MGYTPKDFYDLEAEGYSANTGILETTPDPYECNLRYRQNAKMNIQRAIIEERICRANRTKPSQIPIKEYKPPCDIQLFRTPERKDEDGWRGPARLLEIDDMGATVKWQGKAYSVPHRHI